jgi:sugar lactone lactonase YvrE
MGTARLASRLALVATLIGGVLVALAPTPAAMADFQRKLRGDFYDIEVVEEHGHLFLSRGRRTDGLLVTDLRGRTITTIQGLSGTTGMVLSPDRSQLYVGLQNEHAIAIVDPDTLAVEKRPLPPWDDYVDFEPGDTVPACPLDLEYLDGAVWFVDKCYTPHRTNWGRLRSYTPSSGRTTTTPGYLDDEADIVADTDGQTLYFSASGTIWAYDVGPAPSRTLSTRASYDWSASTGLGCEPQYGAGQFVTVPNRNLVMAAKGFYLDRDDLHYAEKFPCKYSYSTRNAVAFRADGMLAVSANTPGHGETFRDPEIEIARPGETHPLRSYRFSKFVASPRHAMGWGQRRLYALTWSSYLFDKSARLRIITPRPPSSLEVSAQKRRFRRGEMVRLNLRFRGGRVPRGYVQIWYWHDSDPSPKARVRLDRSGHSAYRFRFRGRTYLFARVVDDGDVIYSNSLILRARRQSG